MYDDESNIFGAIGIFLVLLFIAALFFSAFFVRFHASQSEVSGIVYNTEISHAISGKTTFSVRAGVDTYVSENNESDFCLPKGSKYLALVEKAANDKNIKVDVTANKYFAIQSPFTCHDNVIVTEVK